MTATSASSITSTRTVTVSVGGSGTATSGTDYSAVSDFDITIAANATTGTGTFTLTPTEDTLVEGGETIGVSGTSPSTQVTGTTVTLTDNDLPAVSLSASPSEVDEDDGATSVTVTATAAAAHTSARTVTVSVGGSGTATSGTDYTAVSDFDVTIAANATSGTGTFTLTPTDDTTVEGDETIGVAGTTAMATVTGTMVTLDDDDTWAVSLSTNPSSVGESDGETSVTVTVTATAIASARTVQISVSGGTATWNTDYAAVGNFNITIAANATSGTGAFDLTPTDDTTVEGSETITVWGQGTSLTVTDATVTLTDDDSGTVTIADASASEGDSIAFTLTLDKAVQGGASLTPSFTDVTATEGTDYDETDQKINFTGTAGETQTLTVTTTEDTDFEADETFTVSLSVSDAPSALTATDTATGTITNDDLPAVTLSVNPSSVGEGAGATSVTVTATAASAHTSARTVTVSVGGSGTATSGTDYAAVTDFTITIAANATSGTGSFTLTPTDDSQAEGSETIGVAGTSANSTVTAATVTLTDNDSAEVTIDDASASEGDSISFTVTLDEAVQGGLTVTPGFSGGTATEGADYTENTAGLTFSGTANETQTFNVATDEDAHVEADETFTVSLSVSGTSASVTASDTATGTITNDDGSAAVTIADASASEGDSISFTVTLDKSVPGGLTVTPSFSGGTAAKGTDYTENTAGLAFSGTASETQTLTVATIEDKAFESDETFTVSLSVSGTSASVTASDTATGTITNDDYPSVALTVAQSSVNVSEGAGDTTVTVTATAASAIASARSVTVSVGGSGTATSGTDYAAVSDFTITIAANQTSGTGTFTLTPTQDTLVEGDETIGVDATISNSTVTAATVTIKDDDSAAVTIADASASEGDTISFTVTLDTEVVGGLTVTPSFTDVTATEGTDYDENTTALSFSGTANETRTFTVSTTEDAVLEANETFTVGLTVSGTTLTGSITSTDTATGAVNNDDSAAVTVNDANADEGNSMMFTVTLSEAVQGGLTVTPGYTNGTAANGDYTKNTSGISFSGTKGETKTFSVSTTEDATLEANETFTVGLTVSNAPSGVTSTDTGTGTINNDDGATVTVNDASASEGEAITFTITLGAAVQGGLTVTPGSYTNGTAASGDYTKNTSGISFSGTKGETKTFTVSTTEDAVLEANETFTVGLSVSGTTLSVTDTDVGTGTINNDDSAAVTVNNANADEGEAMTFTVTLSEAVQGGLTVTPDFTDGTAVEGTDYDENTAALSFSGTKGETKTFTVSTTEDAVLESDETFTVGLSASNQPTGTTVTSTDTGTGTINNDDAATVTVNDSSASEGGSMTFTVTLSAAVQGGLTVTPGYANGTASDGDYTKNVTGISFSGTKGETKTFMVSTKEDAVLEADETFTVDLTVSNAPAGTTVTATDTGTGKIENDDATEVTVNDANADEGNTMTFTVTLSEAVQGGLTVTPAYTNGTAADDDYTKNTTGISFSGTKGETQTFTVSTKEDEVVEVNETFTVGLTASDAPSGVTSTDTGTGTITNDDGATVTVNNASASEGDAITFTITLGDAVQGGLTVTPGYTNGTAGSGDYTANTSDVDFTGTKGETQAFTVSTTEDGVFEADETFTVDLTVSKSDIDATDTGTGTINNDDSAAVTINDDSANEGADLSFTVSLDNDVQGGLTVALQYGGTAAGGTDYTAHATPLSFSGTKNETKSFTVSTVEDEIVEGNESITIALSVSKAPPGVTATDTGAGTIEDDDTATVSIGSGAAGKVALSSEVVLASASATEGAGISFTVTLDKAVVGGCSVTPVYTNVTTGANDYAENVSEITFTGTAGEQKSFTVWTTQDAVVEHDETFEVGVTVSGTTLDVVAPGDATGAIRNDDSAELTVDDARGDEGDDLTFTLSLDEAVQGGLTVTPGYVNGTADANDYVANASAIRFRGWAGETKTFSVATVEDAAIETDESFTVDLTVSNAPDGITDADTGTGTINNDDGATVTINDARADEGGNIAFTVNLGGEVQGGLTVTPVYTDVTASAGVDYTANVAAIVFNGTAGETRTLTVVTAQDTVAEGAETFSVGLKVSKSGIHAADVGVGTIVDDDAPDDDRNDDVSGDATVTIANASATEGEALTFTLTLNRAVSGGLTVTPVYSEGTASAGVDYTANVAAIDFTGTAGETRTFSVATVQDAEVEGDETFTVGLSVSNAPAGVTAGTALGTITDDDGTSGGATLTIADTSATEGEALTFTVTLNRAVAGGLTVTPGYTNGTAADGDYTKNVAALTFSGTAGETQTLTVPTTQDDVIENDETFTVSLTVSDAPTGVTAGAAATGAIIDDDEAVVTIADTSATEGEALTFRVRLNKPVADGLTVTPVYTDVTTSNGNDYTENATALTFSGTAGEQHAIVVPTVDDDLIEDRETFTLSLTVSDAPAGVTAGSATGVIEDDDMVSPPLAPEAPVVSALSRFALNAEWVEPQVIPEVTDYDLRYRVADSETDFIDAGFDGTDAAAILEGLTPSTAYEVQVRAVNAEGAGPWSPSGRAQTHANNGPILLGAIPDQVLMMGTDGSVRVERYFEDPDEDVLTYETAAEGGIVRVSVSDGAAKLVPLAVGAASVAVTATDPFGLSARQFFSVTVEVDQGARARALKMSLAAFGRTVASQAVDAVGGRFDAESREARATVGGQSLDPGSDGAMTWINGAVRLMDRDGVFNAMESPTANGPNRADEPGMALPNGRDLVTRSSFNLALERGRADGGADAQAANGWMLWGHGAQTAFTGTPESDLSLDGRVGAAYVGADRRLGGNALAGLAFSHSNGTIDHLSAGIAGRVKARVTSVHPYAHWSPREGTQVWALLGLGLGDAEMDTDEDNVKTDIGMVLAAIGGSRSLQSLGAVDLAVKGDAFLVNVGADAVERLGEVRGASRRIRLMLEGETQSELSPHTRLTPGLVLGVRADGGDVEDGVGTELAGRLLLANSRLGLNLDARGHWLAAHQDGGFYERGVSLALRFDPGSDNEGWALGIEPAWGANANGGVRTFRPGGDHGRPRQDDGAEAMGWGPNSTRATLSYAGAVRDGRFEPFAAADVEGGNLARMAGGLRFDLPAGPEALTQALRFELIGERLQADRGDAASGAAARYNLAFSLIGTF